MVQELNLSYLFTQLTHGSNQRLNEMPEMQREEILAQRQEELQVLTDKLNLTKFLASQRELHGGGGMADDSVAQAAKRASLCPRDFIYRE